MKKLDLYIIKKFLSTYILCIALLIIIVIFFDVSEKIDDFLSERAKDATLKDIIFTYYGNYIPYFISLFSPLFTFIAVIFFTSRIAYRSEIIAILTNGISFWRILVPYIITAIFLTILNIYLNTFVIPHANRGRLMFEYTFIKNPVRNWDRNIHRQIELNTFAYFESFNVINNTGYKFSIEKIKDGQLYYKLLADYIKWDTLTHKWSIHNYFIRELDGIKEKLTMGERIDTVLNITPAEFTKRKDDIEMLNYNELKLFISEEKEKGVDKISQYQVEMYERFSTPFATIILTLIGVSVSSRKIRGGTGMHLGIGVFLTFTYILFMQISTTSSMYAALPPLLGVWIPNIIFLFIAIYLLFKAPK